MKDKQGNELSFEKAVDGIKGNQTESAIAKAKEMGYTVDINKGTISKPKTNFSKSPKRNSLAEMREMTHAARTGGMNMIPIPKNDPISSAYYDYINNLYPYGYSDEGKDTMSGAAKKATKGLFGKSEKKDAVDEFVNLDLNDAKQKQRAIELKNKYFNNFNSRDLNYIQQGMRARLDANSLWANQPQRWNTWIENPDYQSPTALSAGAKTYTYRDPELRKKQQQLALQYSRSQSENGIYPVKNDILNTFNNYTINRMNDDGSGRYLEKWDFMGVDIPGSKGIYIGDTIPANVGGKGTFIQKGDNLSLAQLLKNQLKK